MIALGPKNKTINLIKNPAIYKIICCYFLTRVLLSDLPFEFTLLYIMKMDISVVKCKHGSL